MKEYPSIDRKIVDIPVYAYDKLDGQALRCEWSRRDGLHKFGSRHRLLSDDTPIMKARGPAAVLAAYGELDAIFRAERVEEATCFFEFYGPRSFAGLHEPDDDHVATLYDVSLHKQGLQLPRVFEKLFRGRVPIPGLLYQGNPNADLIRAVRERTLEGMTYEGVVCKGAPPKRGYPPTMFKIKSEAWIKAVTARWGDDPKRLAELL